LFHAHHPSSGAGKIGDVMAYMPSGLSLTPPQEQQQQMLSSGANITSELMNVKLLQKESGGYHKISEQKPITGGVLAQEGSLESEAIVKGEELEHFIYS
jgi:hypothetical protein